MSSIEKDFDKLLSKAITANSNHKSLKTTGLWIVIGLGIAFFSPHNSTNNRNPIALGSNITQIANITYCKD